MFCSCADRKSDPNSNKILIKVLANFKKWLRRNIVSNVNMENTHFIDKEPDRFEALAELIKQNVESMNETQIEEAICEYQEKLGHHSR